MRDPYDVLGVGRNAGPVAIKKAYRDLARQLHPDQDPGNPWAEEEFKELAAAYDLLSDPGKRRLFDHRVIGADGAPRRRPGARPDGHPFHPFDRFFRQRGRRKGGGVKVNGANVSYDLEVGFMEAARGVTKRIDVTNGKRLDVAVPPGTEDGQILRLKGQGMRGLGGGDDGDARVSVAVRGHPLFTRQGRNIRIELPVTLDEAVLGGRIEVPTIDGPVSLTVPEGSNSGTVLRLKGKGLAPPGKQRGDQLVSLRLVLPDKPDQELSDFVRRWSAKHPYDARRRKAPAE